MAKKLNPMIVQKRLAEKGIYLFTPLEFRRLFGVSRSAATFFLFRHTKSGLFVRLKNGLYALTSRLPSEEEIANRLYQPSYISFESVLAHHGVMPESVYTITSATTKPSRRFEVEGRAYEYHTIKREAYSGYQTVKTNGRAVLRAVPEKALVDTLYFVHLKKRRLSDRLDLSRLSRRAILRYARLFRSDPFEKKVKEVL